MASSVLHERFQTWQQQGFFAKIMQVLVRSYARTRRIQWQWQAIDSRTSAAPLGGAATGKNPTDRAKRGSKIHLLVDQRGAPLAVQISGANQHDTCMVTSVVLAVVVRRPTSRQHFCADRGYDYTDVHEFVLKAGYELHIKHRRRRGEAPAPVGDIPGEAQFPARRWVVERDDDVLRLPLSDRFTLQLTGHQLQALRTFAEQGVDRLNRREQETLERLELVRFNTFAGGGRGAWELTKLGQIPLGQLSLRLFNEIQEPRLIDKLFELKMAAGDAHCAEAADLAERLADLRIYQAQLRRILATTRYLLQIDAAGETLHKIGVTSRPVEERVSEIAQALRPYLGYGNDS